VGVTCELGSNHLTILTVLPMKDHCSKLF